MIRRWSRVNLINNCSNFSKKKYFQYFFVSFKKSIIFKKYRVKNTRFIRRALVKAKHKGNWTIYLQIFKNWVSDFKFSKSFTKYQLFNEMFLTKLLTYDFYHMNLRLFNNYETRFFLTNHLTKKMKNVYAPLNFQWDFNNAPTNTTQILQNSDLILFKTDKPIIFPLYVDTGKLWYFIKPESLVLSLNFDFNIIIYQHHNLLWKQHSHLYKNLIYIWIFKLFQK